MNSDWMVLPALGLASVVAYVLSFLFFLMMLWMTVRTVRNTWHKKKPEKAIEPTAEQIEEMLEQNLSPAIDWLKSWLEIAEQQRDEDLRERDEARMLFLEPQVRAEIDRLEWERDAAMALYKGAKQG